MATVSETSGAKPQLAAGLAQGVETISANEQVNFNLYVKLVLPLDGYVFWVNANLLNDSAIYNALTYGFGEFNNRGQNLPLKTITANGSFHYATDMHQQDDKFVAYNHVIFTSTRLIQDFNLVNPNLMYIATYEGLRFGFSRKENFYKQADLYHYRGDSLYSTMTTQIIDTMNGFDSTSVIVSNSLPIWLSLNKYFTLYPSYLLPQNSLPPYASVDIFPASTTAIQAFPLLDKMSNPNQLVHDQVKITVYGTRNNEALNFANYVFQYSLNTDNFGVMNMPVIQDEKFTQPEFGIIAQKKSITFDISYYQTTVNNIAQKLIESAFINVTIADFTFS